MRHHDALPDALVAGPCFGGCSPGDLRALAAAGREVRLPAGWPLIAEGTPADACYVLLDGRVRVVTHGEPVATLEPCAVIGEMGLLGRSLRTASVFTLEPVRALRVEYDELTRLLGARPTLAAAFEQVYDQHLAGVGG